MEVQGLHAWHGKNHVLKGIHMRIAPRRVTAIIGPSGCGKSTLVRCLNRMHEVTVGARVVGRVLLDGRDIYARGVDPVTVRRRVGMVFQNPAPFPTMSVLGNVAAGLRLNGLRNGTTGRQVEENLRRVGLWDEVEGRLELAGTALSGGQQQRLCLARALAVEPEVLLLDEPCSALDPISTMKIEELLKEFKQEYTIVIVTHNLAQAARVADYTGFLLQGELVEFGPTAQLFTTPRDLRTEAYITGRFG